VHHRLHPGSNRLKTGQPQQVEGCRSQRGHRSCAIAAVPVRILMELGIADPVPAFNAPAVTHQLQQGFWGGAQAGVAPRGAPGEPLEVGGLKWLAITTAGGHHLHDLAGADPVLADVLRCLFCSQHPGDVAAMADLVIPCHERDPALSLELAADLAVERLLVSLLLRRSLRLHRQEEVGPLLLELPQNRPLMVFAGGVAGLAVAIRLVRSSTPHPKRPNTA
jgi:hypothetical protein